MQPAYIRYANQGATRNRPLSSNLIGALAFLEGLGVQAEVFSGGQPGIGTSPHRVGSTRHDHGDAADVFFYKDGRKLDWANPADLPTFQEIVRQGKAAGLTGFGAGPGYMQPGSMHIGFGAPAVWGAGGKGANAPDWLRVAYGQAPQGQTTMVGSSGGDTVGARAEPVGIFQAMQMPEEKRGGLFNLPESTRDRLRMSFAAMSPQNPNSRFIMAQAQQSINDRADRRDKVETANKTAQWLANNGFADLAQGVASGALPGNAALGEALARQRAAAQPGARVLTAADVRAQFPGAKVEDGSLYNYDKGKLTKVGGGGQTINVGEGQTAYEKETGKIRAQADMEAVNTGNAAARNLGRINRLETLLQEAGGGGGATAWGAIASRWGFGNDQGDAALAAEALINSLVPEQRPPGSGTMSDADTALFKSSLPALLNSPGGNALIIQTMRQIAEYDMAMGDIAFRMTQGEITRAEAREEQKKLANPLDGFEARRDAVTQPQGGSQEAVSEPQAGADVPQSDTPKEPPKPISAAQARAMTYQQAQSYIDAHESAGGALTDIPDDVFNALLAVIGGQ